ncbi:MAG: glycosyltransferase [Sulfurimonas sp.]|uniref:glycosyltransferase n=1 Tax=Sulfurimonas sp. TaxID=2022749 RepID=UPI002615BD6E|nr:glycosyltransferase [Sulfurimonas sp.]MDD5371927.1 glycosyltransferase [Sulfurimonas sp.]
MYKNILPKFAILLAAYNGTRWIEEQVDTILNQRNVDVEIFISIDISTDGTRILLENLYKNNAKIHILDDVQRFGGAAKNFYRLIKDVDFSRFDYLSLSDQDDIWNSDKLYNAHQLISSQGYDAYSGNVEAFWEDGKTMLIDKAQEQTCCDYLFEAAGPGCTYVISNRLAMHIKEFLTANWSEVNKIELHDWFIYAFSRVNNYKWYIDKQTNMLYRQHDTNQVGVNSGIRAILKRFMMIKSQWYREETIKIITVLNLKSRYKFTSYIINKSFLNNLLLIGSLFSFRRKFSDKIFFLLVCSLGIY